MSDTLDTLDDYKVFDNLITITYTPYTAPRTQVVINYVKIYSATQVPASVAGTSVPTVGTKFCIFKGEFATAPEANGRIQALGRSYRILGTVETSWSNRWIVTSIMDAGGTL